MLHGRNIIVYKDDKAIACCRSSEITTNGDLIEISSPSSAQAKEYIRGRYDWKIDVTGFVTTFDYLQECLNLPKDTAPCQLAFFLRGSDERMGGSAFCTSCKCTGTVGNLAQLSVSFQGTGDLAPLTSSAT